MEEMTIELKGMSARNIKTEAQRGKQTENTEDSSWDIWELVKRSNV